MSTITIQNFFTAATGATSPLSFVVEGEAVLLTLQKEEPRFWGLWSSLSDKDQFLNWQTWQVFKRALREAAGTDQRFARIEKRYQFKWERHDALRLDHIERAGVGLARPFTEDLRHRFRCDPHTMTREALHKAYSELRGDPFIGKLPPSGGDGLSFRYDPFLWDKKRQHLSHGIEGLIATDNPQQTNFPYIDRLAKSFSAYELQPGEIIPMLLPDGAIDYWEVYEKLGTGDGLVGYAFRKIACDSPLAPTFLLRSTQLSPVAEDAAESFIENDLEACIGNTGYSAAKGQFEALLKDPEFRPTGQQVHIIGFSLGGTQAMRFLCDYWKETEVATIINAPSLEASAAEELARQVNAHLATHIFLTIHHYRNRAGKIQGGDVSDYFGEKAVGWGFTNPHARVYVREFQKLAPTTKLTDRVLGPHTAKRYDSEKFEAFPVWSCPQSELDSQLNNAVREDPIPTYEARRKTYGTGCCYPILRTLYRFVLWVLGLFGIESRSSQVASSPS